MAVEISLMSNSKNKIIGFNSLKSYASVNHQHLQLVYLNTDSIQEAQSSGRMYPFSVQNVNVIPSYLYLIYLKLKEKIMLDKFGR